MKKCSHCGMLPMALACPFCRGLIPLDQNAVDEEPEALKSSTATPIIFHTPEQPEVKTVAPQQPTLSQEDEERYRDVLFELRQEDIIHDDTEPTPTNLVGAEVVYNHMLEKQGGFFGYLGELDNEQQEKIRVMYEAAIEAGQPLE